MKLREYKSELQSPRPRNPGDVYSLFNWERDRSDALQFNDLYWPLQWELWKHGQLHSLRGIDLNVTPSTTTGKVSAAMMAAVITVAVSCSVSMTDLTRPAPAALSRYISPP
ncbi:hypothetical protein SKAU_G00216140 [Synaphobranchus kaupii]|uniref:Uncharacterized protein n=1 Tax=Synaphobranchus kaupii TaxID=118154 RepID=A0A9Q1IUJ2_SYNKA|nr:hypothetical protein SKAU_G00216140 [Synaphobranchus kaupii]